jgi:hypothetical protein
MLNGLGNMRSITPNTVIRQGSEGEDDEDLSRAIYSKHLDIDLSHNNIS